MPYLLGKSRFGINFFAKRNTILLLYMYQVFIFLQDHLHFFLHFFFTFMEQLFLDDPISTIGSPLPASQAPSVSAPKRRVIWWVRSREVAPLRPSFFPCGEKNFSILLDSFTLHVLNQWLRFAPISPPPEFTYETGWKKISWGQEKRPQNCGHVCAAVKKWLKRFFPQIRKRHDLIQFDVKSKRLKLQNPDW